MRRRRGWWLLTALGLATGARREVRAAELAVDAPPACVEPETVAQEVSDLIGRPLAEVPGVGFSVRIAQISPQKWRLKVETIDDAAANTVRGSREIDGASCAELAEAASVAIAVSVRSIEAARAPSPTAAALARPSPPPSSPAAPTTLIGASAPAPPSWRPALTLAFAIDSGALPGTSPGLELEADVQRGRLRVLLLGTWFASQETAAPSGAGGTFQLALGGGLACYAPRWGRWTALACGGGELGRLAGTGNVARPETGAVLWRALRVEAGVTAAVGGNSAILLRAGVVRPLSRPDFVLDQSELVYRPGPVTIRVTAGFELGF